MALAFDFRDRVKFISNTCNRGFAGVVNQSFAATTSPSVLILNPDVRVTPGAVQQLHAVLQNHSRAAVVGEFLNVN